MAKLYYRYGAMNASKSANLLMIAHNYQSQGRRILIYKSCLDTRSSSGRIESRIGLSQECLDVDAGFDFYESVIREGPVEAILIDECQFLTGRQVEQLVRLTIEPRINVLCFGLKNSSVKGRLFEGSLALLYYADSIGEIKTLCRFCRRKANQNLRIVDGRPDYGGNVINPGDVAQAENYYHPVCNRHYLYPEINQERQER